MFNALYNGEIPIFLFFLPQLELDGQLLYYKENTKVFDVYLTTKLNWRLCTENLITKTRKRIVSR